MPATGEAKNIGLTAMWKTTQRFVGGGTNSAAQTVESSTAGKTINKTGNSLANGNLVYFTVISGGKGLVALRPYYVVGKAANTYELSNTEGGTGVSFTTTLNATSEIVVVTELSGGAYTRIEMNMGTVAEGSVEDVTVHNLKVPAGKTISVEIYNEAVSGTGAGKRFLGISVLTTPETYGSEGIYEVKSTTADMMLAEGTPAP